MGEIFLADGPFDKSLAIWECQHRTPPLKTLPFLITIPQPIFFEFFLDRGRKQIIWLQEGRGNV